MNLEKMASEVQKISIDRKGNVLVQDFYSNRVQVFNEEGQHLFSITCTEIDKPIYQPAALVIGPDNCIYNVQKYPSRLSVFCEDRKYLKFFSINQNGNMNHIMGITINAEGYLHVSDRSQVYVFR